MFPKAYFSIRGRIHMGHVRKLYMAMSFAAIRSRRATMSLHPMGWDAFGIASEKTRDGDFGATQRLGPTANMPTSRGQMKTSG